MFHATFCSARANLDFGLAVEPLVRGQRHIGERARALTLGPGRGLGGASDQPLHLFLHRREVADTVGVAFASRRITVAARQLGDWLSPGRKALSRLS